MNTPTQCGAIKPPKTDIYSEAPHHGSLLVLSVAHIPSLRSDLNLRHVHDDRTTPAGGRQVEQFVHRVDIGFVRIEGHGRGHWALSNGSLETPSRE